MIEDSPVPSSILARIASRVYIEHLAEFATTLLGVDPVKYGHLTYDAGQNAWKCCSEVSMICSVCVVIKAINFT